MLATVLPWVAGAFVLALLLNLWRLLRGPALADRIIALDTMYVNALVLLVLAGLIYDSTDFFEAALVIALLGFVSTAVLAKFAARGDVAE